MFPVASLPCAADSPAPRVQIVLLVAICALARKFGGSWREVFARLWPFLIYSAMLSICLEHSPREAFGLTALVHALYNATFFCVCALGTLMAGPGRLSHRNLDVAEHDSSPLGAIPEARSLACGTPTAALMRQVGGPLVAAPPLGQPKSRLVRPVQWQGRNG